MGLTVLNPGSTYLRLAWPTHPSRTSQKLVINSPTPFFQYSNWNIKKTWMPFMLTLIDSGFGTKPMASSALPYGQLFCVSNFK
jgi:hypothetical protein